MKFVSADQHSLEQIASVEKLCQLKTVGIKDALFVATQLVTHASIYAEPYLEALRQSDLHPDVSAYLRKLGNQLRVILNLKELAAVKNNDDLVAKLYQTDGFVFLRGTVHPEKLLVVFTTMFNNFHLSNVVFYALLKEMGISVLFLKDCTYFNYLKGVAGLGDDVRSLARGITDIATENGATAVYLTGFSSGGYSSLYCSYLMPCSGYLGCSIASDLSERSALFPGKYFIEAAREKLNARDLINLRELANSHCDSVKRRLIYGEDSNNDAGHAFNMRGLPRLELVEVPNCEHQTIAALVEEETLPAYIRDLVFQT